MWNVTHICHAHQQAKALISTTISFLTVFCWVTVSRVLLSKVDNIFSRLQHDLLATLANNCPDNTISVSMPVDAAMAQPAWTVCERFTTHLAAMGLDTVVLHAVRPRRRQMKKSFAASLTTVAGIAVVDSCAVTPHCWQVSEAACTLGTLVWPLSGVDWHVLL